jgi:hypothetical protein
MHVTPRRFRSKSRAALLWTLAFFLVGQAALGVFVYLRHPEMCDAEFRIRLRDLRARLEDAPGRPLAMIVGNSRTAMGFRPASASKMSAPDGRVPILFNFGMLGAGPVRERMVLRRVLRSGVKPDWLFVEVWAPFLLQRGFFQEEHNIFERDMYWADVPIMSRLYRRRWDAFTNVFEATVSPGVHYRTSLLGRYAPFLLPPLSSSALDFGELAWDKLDGAGWLPSPFERPGPDGFALLMENAKKLTKPLLDEFQISEVSDRALRDLLDECNAHAIRVALLILPEHSMLRSWYPPGTRSALSAYLHRLGHAYHAPVIDARAWCGDEEFGDYCHLLPAGARSFSERFGREVYRPLLQGRALGDAVLLHEPSFNDASAKHR